MRKTPTPLIARFFFQRRVGRLNPKFNTLDLKKSGAPESTRDQLGGKVRCYVSDGDAASEPFKGDSGATSLDRLSLTGKSSLLLLHHRFFFFIVIYRKAPSVEAIDGYFFFFLLLWSLLIVPV